MVSRDTLGEHYLFKHTSRLRYCKGSHNYYNNDDNEDWRGVGSRIRRWCKRANKRPAKELCVK